MTTPKRVPIIKADLFSRNSNIYTVKSTGSVKELVFELKTVYYSKLFLSVSQYARSMGQLVSPTRNRWTFHTAAVALLFVDNTLLD